MNRIQEELELIREAGAVLTLACEDGPANPDDVENAIREFGSSNPLVVFDVASQLELMLLLMDENEIQH